MTFFTKYHTDRSLEAVYTGRFAYSAYPPKVVEGILEDYRKNEVQPPDPETEGGRIYRVITHEFLHSILLVRMKSMYLLNRLRFVARYFERQTVGIYQDSIGKWNVGDMSLYDLYFNLQAIFYERVYEEHEMIVSYLEERCFSLDIKGGRLKDLIVDCEEFINQGGSLEDGTSINEILKLEDHELIRSFKEAASRPGRFKGYFRNQSALSLLKNLLNNPIILYPSHWSIHRFMKDFTFIATDLLPTNEIWRINISSGGIINRLDNKKGYTKKKTIKALGSFLWNLRPEKNRDNTFETDIAVFMTKIHSQSDYLFRSGIDRYKEHRLRMDRDLFRFLRRFACLSTVQNIHSDLSKTIEEEKLFLLQYPLFDMIIKNCLEHLVDNISSPTRLEFEVSTAEDQKELFCRTFRELFHMRSGICREPLFQTLTRQINGTGGIQDKIDFPHEFTIRKIQSVINYFYMHGS